MPLLCLSLTNFVPAVSRTTGVITSQQDVVPREPKPFLHTEYSVAIVMRNLS